MITIKDLKKEIKRQHRAIKKGKRYNYSFLGFVENKDLSSEVENFFKIITPAGYTFFDWVNGTEALKEFIKSTTNGRRLK